jgi:SAM-dependent methyltransferase
LHVPKEELPKVLQEVEAVLKPGGLFYLGIYGGQDSEGIWEEDYYQPQRFFSFYTDEQIQEVVSERFDLLHFDTVPIKDTVHFQSMILQKRS